MLSIFEPIPFAVTSNLIDRLASLDFLEFGEKHGVTEDLEELKNTIECIYEVFLDADNKQDQARVRKWIRKFKDVLHHADNLLDDLAIEYMKQKLDVEEGKEVTNKVLYLCSSSNQIDFNFPIHMAEELKKVRGAFDDIVEGMFKLNLSPRSVMVKQTDSGWRETSSFVLESNIIRRDDNKKEIISLLTQPNVNQNVSVIAIVGIGGLGKTTMAQFVYNDLEVRKTFEKRMWVCVSDNFDVKTILRNILESLTGQNEDKLSLDNLQNRLRAYLSGKKYLLVLDDIWNESHKKWDELRTYLMCGAQDSKVLVTTRSESVAKTMRASSSYPLRGLTAEESWSLLKNIAFDDDTKGVNQNLEATGKEIAKKCNGIPLAIRTLGGLLQQQNEESEWKDVLHGDFWKLCEDQDSIMPILKLSYKNLSPEMRQCFAYCSLYPKDSVIFKDELIHLWMAQGYLKCSKKQHMEDVGDGFVKTFLMNSFFQDANYTKYGEIINFKMHDLMHDLAMFVAGNDCCYLDNEAKSLVGRPMHVSMESKAIHLLDSLDVSELRTLILWSYGYTEKDLSFISNFKYVRVLKVPSSKLPDSIGKLKHLRYLNLSNQSYFFVSLPKSLSNLIFLQTLKFDGCDQEFFKEAIIKLVNLRWLDIDIGGITVGLGKLSSLHFLPVFVVGDSQERKYGTLNELKDLHYLRGKLEIKQLNHVRDVTQESQDVNLKGKYLLESLYLYWFGDKNQRGIRNSDSLQLLENLRPHHNLKELRVHGYPGACFPNWLSSLTNIVEISLSEFSHCRCLPPLESLPWLKSLKIESLEELEYIYVEDDGFAVTFFPSLETLKLYNCPKLRGWWRRGDDNNDAKNLHHLSLPPPFPHLPYLRISYCPKLTRMPPFPTVKVLDLYNCGGVEPLIATLNIVESTVSTNSSSSTTPLSKLKRLMISESLNVKALPKGWMQNLTSLEFLEISFWESKTIEEFETGFTNDTNSLPFLREISIRWCENLEALPDWICNFSSLQQIKIFGCPNLASLPEGMTSLTNLKILEIQYCSLLLKECWKETSAVRRQIAHIPEVILQ